MEQSQVMRESSRKCRAARGQEIVGGKSPTSSRGSGWKPRESEVQERAGQDKARSNKVGKRRGSGGDVGEKGGLEKGVSV